MTTNKCRWELDTSFLYDSVYLYENPVYVYNTSCHHVFEAVGGVDVPIEETIKRCPWCGREIEEWLWEWE